MLGSKYLPPTWKRLTYKDYRLSTEQPITVDLCSHCYDSFGSWLEDMFSRSLKMHDDEGSATG